MFIIAACSLVLLVHFVASLLGATDISRALALPGVPLAAMTAIYTGYLFAQAKARDLWENLLLPPHLLIDELLAGSAVLVPFAAWLEPSAPQAALSPSASRASRTCCSCWAR